MSKEFENKVKELKAKYGTIYKLDVPVGDEVETLLLRPLDRVVYSAGSKLMEKDELLAGETFLRSLTVDGDAEKVIENFESLRSAVILLVDVIGVKQGNVQKL